MGSSTVGILIAFVCLLVAVCGGRPKKLNPEAKLTQAILTGYAEIGNIARPVLKSTDTQTVSVGLALIHINDMNTEKSVVSLNAWLKLKWKDMYLKWDPKHFGNVTDIRIPVKYIWKPDVVLYNKGYIDGYGGMTITDDAMAVVFHTGEVLWIPPVHIVSLCGGIFKNTAQCLVKLGSWTYDGYKVDLALFDGKKSIDMADYHPDNRYMVLNTSASKQTIYYPCCEEPYPDIRFNVTFRLN